MGQLPQSLQPEMQLLRSYLEADRSDIQSYINTLSMGIVIHDKDGCISHINKAAGDFLAETDLIGLSISDFIGKCQFINPKTNLSYPPDKFPASQVLKDQQIRKITIGMDKGSCLTLLQVKGIPIKNDSGKITHVVTAYEEITKKISPAAIAHHQAHDFEGEIAPQRPTSDQKVCANAWMQQQRHPNSTVFEQIAEEIPGIVYILSGSGRQLTCEYVAPEIETIYEAPLSAIVDRPAVYFLGQMRQEDRRGFLAEVARCTKTRQPLTHKWRNVSPSGRVRWLKTRVRPTPQSDGTLRWYGILFDDSDHPPPHSSPDTEASESRAILSAIPDLIVRVNREGRYITRILNNPNFSLLAVDEDFVGKTMWDYLPKGVADRQYRYIQKALDSNTLQIFEQTISFQNRVQYEEVRVIPCGADEALLIIRDVSDRKLAEISLREREIEYQRLVRALPDLMFRINRDGYWLGYVQTNANIDYLPKEYDPTGQHISNHMPPELAARQLKAIERAIETDTMQVFEQQFTIDGRFQYEEVRIVPQGSDEVLFIVRDITDRKQAELALRQSEAENRAMLAAIPDLMFRLDRNGTYLAYFRNEKTRDLLEKEIDPIGHTIFEFAKDSYALAHIEAQIKAVHEVMDSQTMMVYEQEVHFGDCLQYEEVRIVPTGPDEVLLIIQNIDDRKTAEIALQQSEAQKKAILKAIPDLIFHMRRDGLILDYMEGSNFTDMFGHVENKVGKNLRDFASNSEMSQHICRKLDAMHQTLATGEMQIFEQETWVENVYQQEEVRIVPVNEDEVLVMIRDITNLKRIEAELRFANERLEKLSLTDPLTTLANRRSLDEHLHREWQRSFREQKPLAFILFDLDFFKRYNDTYGHQQGDDCLYKIAQIALSVVNRSSDLVARYGGEEFAIVLSNTPLKGAFTIAQRLRKAIKNLNIPHDSSEVCQYVTASVGVSSLIPSVHEQPNLLIRQADQALYAAKQAGRDNCQCYFAR